MILFQLAHLKCTGNRKSHVIQEDPEVAVASPFDLKRPIYFDLSVHFFFDAVGVVSIKEFSGRIIRLPAKHVHFMAALQEPFHDIIDAEILRPVMLAYD